MKNQLELRVQMIEELDVCALCACVRACALTCTLYQ
jgi:hypothetical protein